MKKNNQDNIGDIPIEPKKRGKKNKRQVEKNLLLEYKFENSEDGENDSLLDKSYDMMQHLSSREKKTFDEKFTIYQYIGLGFAVLAILLVILALIIAFNKLRGSEDDEEELGGEETSAGQTYY